MFDDSKCYPAPSLTQAWGVGTREGAITTNELPPDVIAHLVFLRDIQSLASSTARDSILDWGFEFAALGGCVLIRRTWAVYSAVSGLLLFYRVKVALDTLQTSVDG